VNDASALEDITYLLCKDKDTIEVHVTHDSHNLPFVLDKGVA
jgi:hypothetical protein